MKINYIYKFLLLTMFLLMNFSISCSNEVTDIIVKKRSCIQEGVYCKGASIYTCKNSDDGEAIEDLIENCDIGQVCFNNECIMEDCDKVINCIQGEKICIDDNSFKTCGNYDRDLCFEWQIETCTDGFHCDDGNCIKNNVSNPCNDVICGDFEHCEVNNETPQCICNDGYHKDGETCVKTCVPKTCEELNIECGYADNGCNENISCGTCIEGTCNNLGKCEITCIPKTCEELNIECGYVDNGCNENISCGTCSANQSCNSLGQCVDDIIVCGDSLHEENNICVSNERTVSCIQVDIPENSSYSDTTALITWNSESGWPEIPNCNWLCDDGYHIENNNLCVSNEQTVPCNSDFAPNNAYYENIEVIIRWENDAWTDTPECNWWCPEDRCLDQENNVCVLYELEYCDGLDNDCDGIIDNNPNDVEGSSCPGECFGKTYNGSVYIFCGDIYSRSWNSAKATCNNNGAGTGYLVSINDEDENNFITDNLSGDYWIGYSQDGDSGNASWDWVNGDSSEFVNWANEEPNNACVKWGRLHVLCKRKENCAMIYAQGSWNDSDCESEKAFICEFSNSPN